jgi:hypothetical protein
MFLKNCWYIGAWDHELIDGKLLRRVLLNEHVLMYRGESGQPRCNERPLSPSRCASLALPVTCRLSFLG